MKILKKEELQGVTNLVIEREETDSFLTPHYSVIKEVLGGLEGEGLIIDARSYSSKFLREYQMEDRPLGTHFWTTFLCSKNSEHRLWIVIHAWDDVLAGGLLGQAANFSGALLQIDGRDDPELSLPRLACISSTDKMRYKEDLAESVYLLKDVKDPSLFGFEFVTELPFENEEMLFWETTHAHEVFEYLREHHGGYLCDVLPAQVVLRAYRPGVDQSNGRLYVRPPDYAKRKALKASADKIEAERAKEKKREQMKSWQKSKLN